jgi:hypothetical protein
MIVIIWLMVVLLTFAAPFWLRWVLLGINCILPDFVPFADEVLQLYAIFNNNVFVKGAKVGKGLKKLSK